jgi:hypothetical protein
MTDNDDNVRGGRKDLRRRAIETYGNAGRRAGSAIDEAPFVALVGGIAAGALIAALLPKTRREEELFRPVGDRLTGSAKAAAAAAKEAGTARLDELGLTPNKGVETLRSILQGAGDAARTSAQAALEAARKGE